MILGINIDHIATLRNVRSEGYPNLVNLALIAQDVGADQITAHLREDRRHIQEQDLIDLKTALDIPLNMEMALTDEMVAIALKLKPHSVCIVPENRNEITTEGGLDVIANQQKLKKFIPLLQDAGIKVALFIDPHEKQLHLVNKLQCNSIEINTGAFANSNNFEVEALKIHKFAQLALINKLSVHAGHGLNFSNIRPLARIKAITEFNIGHFLISYALFVGFKTSILEMKNLIMQYR